MIPHNQDMIQQARQQSQSLHSFLDEYNTAGGPQEDADELARMLAYEREALNGQWFIWKTPERAGQRVQFQDLQIEGGRKMIYFSDGTGIDAEQIGSSNVIEPISAGPRSQEQPGVPGMIVDEIDPLGYGNHTVREAIEEDPIHLILKKRKARPIEVTIAVPINIPSQSIIEILREDYEDADEKILAYILKSVDHGEIGERLRIAVEKYITQSDEA